MLALLFVGGDAWAECWTLRTRADSVFVWHERHAFKCYGKREKLLCFSAAVFATDEPVGHLLLREDQTSTFEISVASMPNPNEVRYEKVPVACRPLTLSNCAAALRESFRRQPTSTHDRF